VIKGLVLAALLVLPGCAYTPFIDTGRNETTVTITWVNEDVAEECYRLTAKVAYGCAAFVKDKCHIWAPMPQGTDDTHSFEILGHEALHCFIGNWHK
jgi:hypothetical protein